MIYETMDEDYALQKKRIMDLLYDFVGADEVNPDKFQVDPIRYFNMKACKEAFEIAKLISKESADGDLSKLEMVNPEASENYKKAYDNLMWAFFDFTESVSNK